MSNKNRFLKGKGSRKMKKLVLMGGKENLSRKIWILDKRNGRASSFFVLGTMSSYGKYIIEMLFDVSLL